LPACTAEEEEEEEEEALVTNAAFQMRRLSVESIPASRGCRSNSCSDAGSGEAAIG
jgi:hypothetical protein